MSYKIKSFVYLSCFIAAFAFYSISMTDSQSNYSDSTEIAIAELDQIDAVLQPNAENPK